MVSLLLIAGAAHAQSAPGTCSGMMAGTASLAVADAGGTWHRLAPTEVPRFFGGAECACDTDDVALEIDLTTALPPSQAVAEIWVGDSSCANAATRTSTANLGCKKIASPAVQDFTVDAAGPAHYPLSSRMLFTLSTGGCGDLPLAANSVWLFVYSDPNNPLGTCTLPLTESNVTPPAPSGVAAAWQPDGSVGVRWTSPPDVSSLAGYDILCAADDGTAEGSRRDANFSRCTPAGIVRRTLMADDGALVSSGPAAAGNALDPPAPDAVCAHVAANATAVTLYGLASGTAHRFAVVAVDAFGNARASEAARLDAAPPAPMTHAGCSMAGRGSVTPWLVIAFAFALLTVASARRRRAAGSDGNSQDEARHTPCYPRAS
jgi:hypothetical protein